MKPGDDTPKITLEEVRQTALLARLEFEPRELEQLTRELDAILGYMEALAKLDVTGVPPTTHAVPLDCPLREDLLGSHLTLEQALSDAPSQEGAFFEVPKIIDLGDSEGGGR